MLLGIDIGGTFTDFVLIDEVGRVHLHKRLTTPADRARAVGEGIRELGLPNNVLVVHGSTVATNALLERRGARTALITTEGFADVLEIGRQNRPDLYALVPRKPAPLVPREWRFELRERVTAAGEILIPLDPRDISHLIPKLQAANIEAVAICFLFSFLRPEHEQLVKQIISQSSLPITVSLSSDILPEYREYERLSTTVINAYVQPLIERYLARLENELAPRPLRVMQSNGGCITSTMARAQAARTALSGPAGGVVGAFEIATQGLPPTPSPMLLARERGEGARGEGVRIISFDMGGTSTDVCLCPGEIPFTAEGEIGGLPLRLPIIDIHTVGAGGGSLARVDAGGALTVGPESAGAEPGPACYGRGGKTVTVTDANLILNRLDPQHFLGGEMTLDRAAAEQALAELGRDLPPDARQPSHLAWGVLQIANATMERAIRKISIERGHDPRDFTLVAFGGAGPLHACELAERLTIPQVLIPRAPGVLSALGMLLADLVKDYSQTVLRPARAVDDETLAGLFAPLELRARTDMAADGVTTPQLERSVDMRYTGQSFEINVPVGRGEFARASAAGTGETRLYINDFHERHEQRYGHAHPNAPVELVNVRVRAIGKTLKPKFEEISSGGEDPSAARVGESATWFTSPTGPQAWRTTLFSRDNLQAGNHVAGPAIIFQLDATTVIPPGWSGVVDRLGHLLLTRHNNRV